MRRSGPGEIPPPLELECLKVLWTLGEGSVKAVREGLAPNRKLAYTTIMTVLDRLARKGAVERHKAGRLFVYAPALSRERLRALAVRQLLDTYFGGSESELIAYLGGERGGQGRTAAEAARGGMEEEEALDPALL